MVFISKVLLSKIDKFEFKKTNNKKILSKKILDLEIKLNKTKTKLDKFYNDKKIYGRKLYVVRKYSDDFFRYKHHIKSYLNNPLISNAWLKCYQLIFEFKLMNSIKKGQSLNYFDNASLPGNFILATFHYYITHHKGTLSKFNWKANSLIEKQKYIKIPLEDTYGLYKCNKKKWLMNNNFNGDVSNIKVVKHIEKINKHSINLYTSDLGFSSQQNYSNQEFLHITPNIGQILCGIISLKKGGSMLTKQYTIFNNININIIALMTFLFDKVYLTKPITSRVRNSEIYLICKSFLGTSNKYYKKIIDFLFDYLKTNKLNNQIKLNKKFIKDVEFFINKTIKAQIDKINEIDKIMTVYDNDDLDKLENQNNKNTPISILWEKKYNIKKNTKEQLKYIKTFKSNKYK